MNVVKGRALFGALSVYFVGRASQAAKSSTKLSGFGFDAYEFLDIDAFCYFRASVTVKRHPFQRLI